MGAYDLIRLSISESLDKDCESLDIIRYFLNTLQNNMDCSPDKLEDRLKKEIDYGDDEIGLLLREVIGDLQLSAEEKYGFKKNFIIPDFIRRLDEFSEFTYRRRHSLRGREKDFQMCLYKIFSRVVGETLGIYYLEIKTMDRFIVDMKRLDKLATEKRSEKVKLQQSGSIKLYEKLRYRKLKEDKLKIAVIDFNYFLNREVIRALKSLGHEIIEIRGRKDESARDILERMMLAIAKYKPDFLLTINHLGFDEEGLFTSFIDSIELPVAVWYVDSPDIIIKSFGKNVSPYVSIFLWDRFYIKEILEMGFESVEYLPIATDEEVFMPIKLAQRDVKRYSTDIGFVGNSWYQRTKEELEGVPEGLHNIVERLSQILSKSRIPFHEALKSLSEDERKATVSLAVHQRLDLEAATYWRATSLYRMSCLQASQEFHPVIHGDFDWRRLTGYEYELKPPLNYYKDLPLFYNACKINFNATSLQMLTAVNQRVFDVPACGAFLLTDDQDALGELFDIGKEVITYKSREEIPGLIKYYLNNSQERKRIAERGRERIVREHTYVHRIKMLIDSMKKRYS
jgi:spore maturation protein CgeB